jgi:membrane associated rhomboid family serine protease
MGIYDRDYYRREGPSFLGSIAERGTVCKWLVGINVVCFIVQLVSTRSTDYDTWSPFTNFLILDVSKVWHGEVWRLLTYAFLHTVGNLWHLAINMLVLYFFGRDVEDTLGPREFLATYLVAAVLGGVAFVLTMPGGGYCLGASGAVVAVLVMAACRDPAKIILLFFVLPCPIWLVVVLMVAKDAFEFLGGVRSGTAVQVHLAGAALGFLHFHFQWRLTDWLPSLKTRWRRRNRPKLRVYEEPREDRQPASVGAPTPALPASQSALDDEQLEAKMDAILEKISRVGKENITASEHEVLLKASERLRRRRS